jgi:hypothetical protein
MRQPPDTAERRPRRKVGVPDDAQGGGIKLSVARRRARCPLVRAAAALGDPAVIAAIELWHAPFRCPAAQRERAA